MYRPKEAKRIDYLDIASKALPILATLGMVLGGMWTFSYLSSIHQLSLFADVMGEPSSLAAVVVVFFLMFFSVSIGFFAPYFFLVFWEDVNKSSLLVEYFQPIGEDCIVRVTRLFVTLLSSFISVFIFLILLFFKLLSPCLLIFCFIIPFVVYSAQILFLKKKNFPVGLKEISFIAIVLLVCVAINFFPLIIFLGLS